MKHKEKNIRKKLSDFEMNSENPFVTKETNFVNKEEVLSNSVFTRRKVVDSEIYVRLLMVGIKDFYGLKPTSVKVLEFILKHQEINRDDFFFFIEDCIKETGCSQSSVFRALGELCRARIIARGRTEEQYYINPMCVFSGDRITFATTYVNGGSQTSKD